MKARLTIAALIAFVVGATAGVGGSAIYYRKSAALFANRLRCRALADEYLKKADGLPLLEEVDFSPSRDSCVVSTFQIYFGDQEYKVFDVISNETLFRESCNDKGGKCGGGVDVKLGQEAEKVFKEAVGR